VSSHDGLKDSWWDQAKGWTSDRWDTFIRWVHTHAGVIATIANVAGWIATGLAFAAITVSFIPALGFLAAPLLAAATAATLVSLTCHVVLALSGDGSYVDVGLDLIGLVTFGYGNVAAKGVEASEQVVKTAATRAARDEGKKAARQTLALQARRTSGRPMSRATRKTLNRQIRRAANRHADQAIREAKAVKPSRLLKFGILDGSGAQTEVRTRTMSKMAANSPRAQAARKAAAIGLRKAAVASWIGIGSDAVDKSGASNPIEPSLTFGRYANR
jgi:hypothetical protein